MSGQAARMRVNIADDRSHATLEMLPASGMTGGLTLTLDQITQLITSLGQARAAMLDAKPVPAMENATFSPVFNTRWMVQPEALTEGSVIAFQHPAYGAVGFVLPPAETEKVVRALTVHMGMVHSSERPQGKPN
ncbi:hypothetical protein NFI95_14510 [Acetobacteraceae bacterium KSS8]|uniref:Uncharacterized protein n=1 Tax=Endosaccharibacter trunci TaxID=2812733 RepID=A0ABT1W9T7_9PROT|nr:hypothetical protein [Acetobacteraceae bacterium KSS8]